MSDWLILVRHAAVAVDTAVSAHKWELTENGRLQTTHLANTLQPYAPNRIFTSPEPKAQQTAAVLAAQWQIPCPVQSGLEEHNRQGEPYLSHERFLQKITSLLARPDELVFGRECGTAARMRWETAVSQLNQQYPQETLVIVTHGTVLTLALAAHNPDLRPFTFWQQLTMPAAIIANRHTFRIKKIHLM
jgi:broad specificity phosphatase PhoE